MERLHYLRRALEDLGWELSAERLEECIADLRGESLNVVRHAVKALKLFIKHMLRNPNLYS
ncbi:MAG: hypothetical protein ACO2O2_08285 [Acidilobaceae archaeon]